LTFPGRLGILDPKRREHGARCGRTGGIKYKKDKVISWN
jgi:hypothetical protein